MSAYPVAVFFGWNMVRSSMNNKAKSTNVDGDTGILRVRERSYLARHMRQCVQWDT